jgi:hypothetical protein
VPRQAAKDAAADLAALQAEQARALSTAMRLEFFGTTPPLEKIRLFHSRSRKVAPISANTSYRQHNEGGSILEEGSLQRLPLEPLMRHCCVLLCVCDIYVLCARCASVLC